MEGNKQEKLKSALRQNLLRRKADNKDGLHRPSKKSKENTNNKENIRIFDKPKP